MTKTNNSKRNQNIQARLNSAEYSKIDNIYKKSSCRSKAQFLRELILNKPITILYRNQSLDDLIEEIVILNNEINAIKNDLSKTMKMIHLHKNSSEFNQGIQETGLKIANLHQIMAQVKNHIEKITDKWLLS